MASGILCSNHQLNKQTAIRLMQPSFRLVLNSFFLSGDQPVALANYLHVSRTYLKIDFSRYAVQFCHSRADGNPVLARLSSFRLVRNRFLVRAINESPDQLRKKPIPDALRLRE
jgi:hypothetical protein